jgi:ATP-dependent Clp protease ATP-binding subunit ClpB
VDEACAKLKNELTSKPTVLDEVDRRIIQLEMERLSIKSDVEKNGLEADMQRLQYLESDLMAMYEEQSQLNARWQSEKAVVLGANELQEKIAAVKLEIEKAEREYDLNRAAELKYGELPELEEQLEEARQKEEDGGVESMNAGDRLLRDEVMPDDIANVISVWTGIPSTKLLSTERERVLTMADKLKERVVGQDEAIDIVTDAIQRNRAGMNDPSKPIASMIFLGPTGVGKTELAKALSEFMFDTEEAMIRIDMSEYMEKVCGLNDVSGKIVCMFLVKSHHHITVSNSFLYSIPCHVYWGHHLGTLATTREVNSQMQCVGVHTRYFYSTKWKRPIPTSSTLCFNCLTMGKLPIAKVTRYLSKIAS